MAPVAFFAASILAIVGAVGVVSLANPFYNVLALVVHLISLAALFLLLRAEFVAAAQIVVYAGAVMVLYVFVVAYVGGQDEPLGGATGGASKGLAYLFAGALLVEICIAVLGAPGTGTMAEAASGRLPAAALEEPVALERETAETGGGW